MEEEMVQAETKTIALRVAEALAKDAGRAIARLDPEDMARLGANESNASA